ncbi:hypothetical protein [Flavobacterium sp.]|uniref:hypothetical protein n=1 Tax=Flavobacterium sp. TaxID=239 RepID=UPI00286BB3FC|nr:hypothetical protein [Flavobacterium sp.]
MQKKVKKENNTQGFKIIIILLSFVVLGSLFYIYKISDRTKSIIVSLREEKLSILKDLEKSNVFLDQAISSKTNLNSQLALEQEKVKKLIVEIKNNNLNLNQINKLKKGVNNVNERIIVLMKELNYYKKKADSTNLILNKQKILNDTLTNNNEVLSKKVTEASKLYYYGLETIAYKLRSSGKKVETEKASKADLFTVSFSIGENKLVKPSSNVLYIQIIDSKNNIVGNKKSKNFGDKTLFFSTQTMVNYKNKTIKIDEELQVENLEEGMYYVNIFDRSNLVLKKKLNLR